MTRQHAGHSAPASAAAKRRRCSPSWPAHYYSFVSKEGIDEVLSLALHALGAASCDSRTYRAGVLIDAVR
jgi:hypothetical protein